MRRGGLDEAPDASGRVEPNAVEGFAAGTLVPGEEAEGEAADAGLLAGVAAEVSPKGSGPRLPRGCSEADPDDEAWPWPAGPDAAKELSGRVSGEKAPLTTCESGNPSTRIAALTDCSAELDGAAVVDVAVVDVVLRLGAWVALLVAVVVAVVFAAVVVVAALVVVAGLVVAPPARWGAARVWVDGAAVMEEVVEDTAELAGAVITLKLCSDQVPSGSGDKVLPW